MKLVCFLIIQLLHYKGSFSIGKLIILYVLMLQVTRNKLPHDGDFFHPETFSNIHLSAVHKYWIGEIRFFWGRLWIIHSNIILFFVYTNPNLNLNTFSVSLCQGKFSILFIFFCGNGHLYNIKLNALPINYPHKSVF